VHITLAFTTTKVHNVQPTIFELLKYRISIKTIEESVESVEKETRSQVVSEEHKRRSHTKSLDKVLLM
jgi:hypothetical protein